MRKILPLLLCALLCGCGMLPLRETPSATAQAAATRTPGRVQALLQRENAPAATSPADMLSAASPAVVGLRVVLRGNSTAEGIGSGFFVDESGLILTNHHVVGDAAEVSVIYHDGSHGNAQLIWSDATLDLAVLQAEGESFTALPLGSSETLRVGDTVYAIGTPLTLQFQHTVTGGIVSALQRTLGVPDARGVNFMEELIQTDAPINPGNSGGPLCNARGEAVGINTLKMTDAEGIGFAIPIDTALPIIQQISRQGYYETPYLGLFAIDGEIAAYYGEMGEGIRVVNIDAGGPLMGSGLSKGDRIVAIDDTALQTVTGLRRYLYGCTPGQQITLHYQRDGASYSCTVQLQKKG